MYFTFPSLVTRAVTLSIFTASQVKKKNSCHQVYFVLIKDPLSNDSEIITDLVAAG